MNKLKSQLLGATIFPEENTILFYGGIFSQWVDCTFSIKIGNEHITVNCAEQAMMLYKAFYFEDMETYGKILFTKHPRDQKALGRMVENFDPKRWDEVALPFVTKVNIAKFGQNVAWRELLIMTGKQKLVEASPTDRIWGIGYSEDNPNVFNERDKWGTNWLGIAIEDARKFIGQNLYKLSE